MKSKNQLWLLTSGFIFLAMEEHRVHAQPLATLEHHVVGLRLRVAPGELFVPKGIPGSLAVDLVTGDGSRPIDVEAIAKDKYIEAVLRGPAFPAYRLLGIPNEPLMLPPIALPGEYQIDNIRLVDSRNLTATPMMGSPSRVAVHVFPEVLVSQVTSRPLSIDEIQARGIRLDARNFSAVEFTAMFAIGGRTIPFRLPVVAPKHKPSTEIIPADELEERLVTARRINRELAQRLTLPPELNLPRLNIHIEGLNFQAVRGDGEAEIDAPSIPGLLVIPGNIGFLNQFFSVQVFAANAAPVGSNITVHSLSARATLPSGDVLRFAATDAPDPDTVPLVAPGADGRISTSDDQGRLRPGQTGQGELLIEGLEAGLHLLEIELNGILDGLAAGEVRIRGHASGSVMVRNPKFSLTFAHPETVQRGDEYEAALTVLNTSDADAHLVTVNLRANSISGARLVDENAYSVALGTIKSGESKTAIFRLEAELTGSVLFNNLTGEDGLTGSFDLTLGVDERGVILSNRTIGYPNWVYVLPPNLRRAADRVLGQALSVSTAGYLPAGIRRVEPQTVARRVTELAEAGQRIKYGDDAVAVYRDLLLDWQGGRDPSLGFDQILRETEAGETWRQALIGAIDDHTTFNDLLVSDDENAESIAGRHEGWGFAASRQPLILPIVNIGGVETTSGLAEVTESASYATTTGAIVAVRNPAQRLSPVQVTFRAPAGQSGEIAWVQDDGDGGALSIKYTIEPNASLACYHYFPGEHSNQLTFDLDCLNQSSSSVIATLNNNLEEHAPELLTATQELDVIVARPYPFCGGPFFRRDYGPNPAAQVYYQNYGTLVAVLFSKQMDAATIERSGAFEVNGEIETNGVRMQPGGRVALVHLRKAIGDIGSQTPTYTIVASEVADRSGHLLAAEKDRDDIHLVADKGVVVKGRVFGVDGAPVPNIPVTLIMNDEMYVPPTCVPSDSRISQVLSDEQGHFNFEFVMSDLRLGYSIAATDTRNLSADAVALLQEASPEGELDSGEIQRLARTPAQIAAFMETFGATTVAAAIAKAEGVDRAVFHDHITPSRIGSTVPVALRFRGRGRVTGTVLAHDEITPVANVAVNLFPDLSSRERGRGVFSGPNGRFQFDGVPLGPFTIRAQSAEGPERIVAGNLTIPGGGVDIDVVLSEAEIPKGSIAGFVVEADQTPSPGAIIALRSSEDASIRPIATADGDGHFEADDIQTGSYELIAVSIDRRRIGRRLNFLIQENVQSNVTLQLSGTAQVHGRVLLANGQDVMNAQVSGGAEIVTSGVNGAFTLNGVPTGRQVISAVLPKTLPGMEVTRLGSTVIDVVPGDSNYAEVQLRAAANISGSVLDENGDAINEPMNVAIPQPGGFYWAPLIDGAFDFYNLSLGSYIISAPAPPVEEQPPGVPPNASEEELLALVGEAFEAYALGSLSQPVTDAASGYGFLRVDLNADNETFTREIRFLPQGTLYGKVRNENEVGIIAQVVARGLKRGANGAPVFGIVGAMNSASVDGAFSFSGLFPGDWTLTAASPFYSVETTAHGTINGNAVNQNLQFGAEVNRGRIRGVVTLDGLPVGGVRVSIPTHHATYSIRTDDNGEFLTDQLISTVHRVLVVDDVEEEISGREPTGRVAFPQILVRDGITTELSIPLLENTGELTIQVVQADGQPAPNSRIRIQRADFYPSVDCPPALIGVVECSRIGAPTTFDNLLQGSYLLSACDAVETALCGSRVVEVTPSMGQSTTVTLREGGTINGTYFAADGVTPVESAQIAIGQVAYAVTDSTGDFSAIGIPAGRHVLVGRNAVTGRAATAVANILYSGHEVVVSLQEDELGEVRGTVIAADQISPIPAATVTLEPSNRLFQSISVSTGPTGQFNFPGVPPGSLTLTAREPISGATANTTIVMPEAGGILESDIVFEPQARLKVRVLLPNGDPAVGARVSIPAGGNDTNAEGWAELVNLPLGPLVVTARGAGNSLSAAQQRVILDQPGTAPDLTMTLGRLGNVVVTVVDGSTSNTDATVTVRGRTLATGPFHETRIGGPYVFEDIPLGAVEVTATDDLQGGSTSGTLTQAGDLHLMVTLSPARNVVGRLWRPTGASFVAVPFAQLNMSFEPVNGGLGGAQATTEGDGTFEFAGIPVGPFILHAELPEGVLYKELEVIETVGAEYDLEDIYLDTDEPYVESTFPPNNAVGISVTEVLEIHFSEAMDESILNEDVVYITDGESRVPVTLAWHDADTLLVDPDEPLESTTTYSLVVRAGTPVNSQGAEGDPGLRDLAHRDLLANSTATFTTIDARRPQIVSFTPLHNQRQVSANSVIRVVFDEPMNINDIDVCVHEVGSSVECVGGTLSLTLRDQVVVYDPVIQNNLNYIVTINEAKDLAGNEFEEFQLPEATATFWTIDNMGPSIGDITYSGGLVTGANVVFTAPVDEETGFQVRAEFRLSGTTFFWSAVGSENVTVTLPDTVDTHYLEFYAFDRFGNPGPVDVISIEVVANQPPEPSIAVTEPASATSFATGSAFQFSFSATDDSVVSRLEGEVEIPTFYTDDDFVNNGGPLVLGGLIPANVGPGYQIRAIARAFDHANLDSSVTEYYDIVDGTIPTITITEPTLLVDSGTSLELDVEAADNFGVAELGIEVTGLDFEQSPYAYSPAQLEVHDDFVIPIPADTLHDSEFTVVIHALDEAELTRTWERTFSVQDKQPPTVSTVSPGNGSQNVEVTTTVFVTFSEPVYGVDDDSFCLEVEGAPGVCVEASIAFDDGQLEAQLTTTIDLSENTSYVVRLSDAIVDINNNALIEHESTFATVDGTNRIPAVGFNRGGLNRFVGGTESSLPGSITLHQDVRRPELTLEFWVVPVATGSILACGSGGALSVNYNVDSQQLTFGVNTTVTGLQTGLGPTALTSGQWHHVALSFEDETFRAYVDGLPVFDVAALGSLAYGSDSLVLSGPAAQRFSEVRVWEGARSIEDIRQNIHMLVAGSSPLYAGWRFHFSSPTADFGENNKPVSLTNGGHGNSVDMQGILLSTVGGPGGTPPPPFDTPIPSFTLTALDLDAGDSVSIVISRLPAYGRLFVGDTSPSSEITSVPYTYNTGIARTMPLLYVRGSTYSATDSIEAFATDGSAESVRRDLSWGLEQPIRWVGGGSNALWSNANNWSPAQVPNSNNYAIIDQDLLTSSVIVSSPATVEHLEILGAPNSFSAISISSAQIFTVLIDLLGGSGSFTDGSGTLSLGHGNSIEGTYRNLRIAGHRLMSGNLTLLGDLSIGNSGRLELGSYTADIDGNLNLGATGSPSAVIVMNHAAAVLDVQGTAYFDCNNTATVFSNGELRLGGDLEARNGVRDCYQPSGAHFLVLRGNVNQTLRSRRPLANVRIAEDAIVTSELSQEINGDFVVQGSLSLDSSLYVIGDFTAESGAVITQGSYSITVEGTCYQDPGASVTPSAVCP